ncbi:hypothetical protein GOQ04_03370 [Emticicia sp. ODNR4P]|nr:hypothetical protein [Emticicia sp. ODNR4P]
MKKTVFLLLAILLSVTVFGQNTKIKKDSCTKEIPCAVLDQAQHDIEAGRICEQQLLIEKKAHYLTLAISLKKDSQIIELAFDNRSLQDENDILKKKIRRRNRLLFLTPLLLLL